MIGSVVASSLRLRALVLVIALIVLAAGVATLRRVPVDVYPEILPPTVTVQTEALGLSAAEVEQLITVPIEADLLAGTPWAEVMRSKSVTGLSSIEIEFKRGTDPMHARQVVQERLTQAHALPNVSKPPHMLQPMSSSNRLMLVGLTSEKQSLMEMSVLARWTIRPRLLSIPGVANVSVWGQRERQLQVRVDTDRMRAAGVSLIQIIRTAGNSLWYSPLTFLEASVAGTGGFIETPNQRIGVRHVLPISRAADLAKLPVEDATVRLDEVANVVEDHQPLIGDGLNKAGAGLVIVVEKLPSANTLQVTDDVLAALTSLKPGLGGIEFDHTIYHPASYIRHAIGNVSTGLLWALGLVALLLMLLHWDWRAGVVGVVALPLALLAALMVMSLYGATLNVMLVAGLVLALGIIVDDGVVFMSGLLRRLRSGHGAGTTRAIQDASADGRGPLAFATALLLLSAVPFLAMADAPGEFVKPMMLTYLLAVLAAVVVAATVTPALSLALFRESASIRGASPFSEWVASLAGRAGPALSRVALGVAVLGTLGALWILPRMHVPTAPTFREHDIMVHWGAHPGTSHTEMSRVIQLASAELRGVPGVKNVGAHVGRAVLADQVVGMHSGELWVSIDPKADYDATVQSVRKIVAGYPGIDAEVETYLSARFKEVLAPVKDPVVVRLYGQRQDVLEQQALLMSESLAGIPGLADRRIRLAATEGEVEIEVNLALAKAYGVKPGDVRRTAATLLSGLEVGNLFEEQKLFEVVVWSDPHTRHSVDAIHDLLVDKPNGGQVRLGQVAEVRIVPAPIMIQRENVARFVDVVADVRGRPASAVAADVTARLKTLSFPLEYRAELRGAYAVQEAARRRVVWVTLVTVVGMVFLVHAATASWMLALLLVLTIPLALSGGLLAAAAMGGISLASLAGGLAVLGVSIRQAILLVRRYQDLRTREGLAFGPALIARGVRDRAAPVLQSALITAAALAPFAVAGSRPGLEILAPMALVILGGMVTATIYSLCLVPVLYARFGGRVEAEFEEDAIEPESAPELARI